MNEIEKAIEEATQAAAAQRSNVWDKARLGRFTSSEIHKLMTEPRSKSKLLSDGAEAYVYAKIAEELTGFEYHVYQGAAIEHGEEYEPAAIAEFMRQTGLIVKQCGFIAHGSFAGGSPDGLIDDHALIEVKCPHNAANHVQNLRIQTSAELLEAHKDYWWQVQANLLFTGRKLAYFISFSPYVPAPLHISWIKIEPDIAAQERLLAKLELALKLKTELVNLLTLKANTIIKKNETNENI